MATGLILGMGGGLMFLGYNKSSKLAYIGGGLFLTLGIALFLLKAAHYSTMAGAS